MKNKIQFLLAHFEEIVLAPAMALMMGINFTNVLARYVFRTSWAATEELCIIGFVYVTFFGAAVAVKKRMHLGFTLILDNMPPRTKLAMETLISLAAVVLMSLMIYYGYKICMNQARYGSATPAMGIPLVCASACVPLGGAAVIFRTVQVYMEDLNACLSALRREGKR